MFERMELGDLELEEEETICETLAKMESENKKDLTTNWIEFNIYLMQGNYDD